MANTEVDDEIDNSLGEDQMEETLSDILKNQHGTENSAVLPDMHSKPTSGKQPITQINVYSNADCENIYTELKKANTILSQLISQVRKTEKRITDIEEKLESCGSNSSVSSGSTSKKQKRKISNFLRVSSYVIIL